METVDLLVRPAGPWLRGSGIAGWAQGSLEQTSAELAVTALRHSAAALRNPGRLFCKHVHVLVRYCT